MTVLWILGGIGYVGAIAAMMKSMASSGLPDRTEFDRAVHGWRFAEPSAATAEDDSTFDGTSSRPVVSPDHDAVAA